MEKIILTTLVKECPSVNITLKVEELIEAINYCIIETYNKFEKQIVDANSETYPSVEQVSKMLGVDKSTLWRWNKKEYLVPVMVGGKRLYKMSDVKQILGGNGNGSN